MKSKVVIKLGKLVVKHAPQIMQAVGAGAVIFGVGLACNKTFDCKEDIEKCQKDIEATKERTNEEEPKVRRKEIVKSYGRAAKKMLVIYGPSALTISAGLCSMLFGHRILMKRHAALLAGYGVLNESYKKYRGNIIEDYGKEADISAKHSLKAEKLNDETVYIPKDDDIFIPDRDLSDFAVFFGKEYSELCTDDPEHNLLILKGQEEYANAIFLEQGYILLQNVYDMLGINRVAPDGIGWVNGLGDNYVDFGIFNVRNGHAVNGDEQVFLLDFNHDGYILPYI